jgi:hypothetical protein
MAGVLGGPKAACAAGGWFGKHARIGVDPMVSTLTYCQPKLVLAMGSTFVKRQELNAYSDEMGTDSDGSGAASEQAALVTVMIAEAPHFSQEFCQ